MLHARTPCRRADLSLKAHFVALPKRNCKGMDMQLHNYKRSSLERAAFADWELLDVQGLSSKRHFPETKIAAAQDDCLVLHHLC
jgi:hypothetical protein